jgi:predicted RNA-binding Zn-ribbon protein involved in translation (DUF1610 family)
MTAFSCPHCGGEIVVTPGPEPLPGWRNSGATGAISSAQPAAQLGIAQVSEVQDLALKVKTYNQGYTRNFEAFWAIYPRHRDKRKAFRAWRNAVARIGATTGATGATAMAQLEDGAARYRDDPNRVDEFTKYAEGWLNGDGWEDEPLPVRLNGRRPEPAFVEQGMSPRTEHVYSDAECPECGVVHGVIR